MVDIECQFVKFRKKQSFCKLPEMARKMIENVLEIVDQQKLDLYFFIKCGLSTLGEAVAHAPPRAQGRYATPRGYAPLESSAMVAFGNQCEPFSIVTPTRANSEGKLQG